ncbi:hypothetical protein MTsN4n12_31500 [Microbacterium sp. MTN4-12]|mgnify:CR=1 FL=1|jgi:hypothetical protein
MTTEESTHVPEVTVESEDTSFGRWLHVINHGAAT